MPYRAQVDSFAYGPLKGAGTLYEHIIISNVIPNRKIPVQQSQTITSFYGTETEDENLPNTTDLRLRCVLRTDSTRLRKSRNIFRTIHGLER